MNKFKKYCPNVFIAECEEAHQKGDVIEVQTKYGKEVECQVFNLIKQDQDKYYYSIARVEEKNYAERRAECFQNASLRSKEQSNAKLEQAQEGREFLILGEPIKVGHHSEKRHRALIERNNKRYEKSFELLEKAEEQEYKAKYWEDKAKEINLSMPESLEYFKHKLEQAKEYHAGLKDGTIKKEHSYSMAYANKDVKELIKKVETAKVLWGFKER